MAAIYNGSDKRLKHLFEEGGGGSSTLADLTDVDLATPTDGQALVYDGANSKWINGDVGGGGGNTLVIQDASIYSTDEQQIGVWIDEKPLYQKTIEIASLPQNSSFQSFAHNIASIDTVAYSDVICKQSDGDVWYLIPTARNSSSMLVLSVDKTTVNILNNWYPMVDVRATIRYTKTTDAAGSGGYKAYGLSPIIYSTEEREVGVWTDGKPLYQKTFAFTAGAINTYNIHDLGLSSSVIDKIKIESCFIKNTYSNTTETVHMAGNYNANPEEEAFVGGLIVANDSWNVYYRLGRYLAGGTLSITLQYTKTTDTAGSGTWTTKGTYAHHYSTSEKVIGTWIDGKPLYERVFTGLSVQLNSVNWVNLVAITDVKFCQDVELYRVIDATTQRRAKLPLAECDANNGYIRVSTISSTFNDVVETAIVRYTKTTD